MGEMQEVKMSSRLIGLCKKAELLGKIFYRNEPKFSDGHASANSADPDQTAPLRTDRPRQTVQTQIRLLLEEQSDQGLHCLQFPLHLSDALLYGQVILFNFLGDYKKFFGCPNI